MNAPASSTTAERNNLRARPKGWPVMHMRWEKLLFLHWRWDVEDLQKRLPKGLVVDTFHGEAWLGVVPFFMAKVRPTGLPWVPVVSNFLELNVRTYVVDQQGRPGVWFFSLACNQPLAVEMARWTFGLNYVHAKMGAPQDDRGWFHYRSQRREAAPNQIHYRPAADGYPAEADTLEHFLVERYMLFSEKGGALYSGLVHHAPYEVSLAEVQEWDFAAVADGFADPGRAPDHALTALDQSVEAWWPQRIR